MSMHAARILRRKEVKELKASACDTRLPELLVANMNNCAVRSAKDGWLAIGKSIQYKDITSHGYHIIREKGLVIDLIECRVLICVKKTGINIVHLVRDAKQQDYVFEHVDRFKGDEIFGGFEQNQSLNVL